MVTNIVNHYFKGKNKIYYIIFSIFLVSIFLIQIILANTVKGYMVVLDGQEIGIVKEIEQVHMILDEIKGQLEEEKGTEVILTLGAIKPLEENVDAELSIDSEDVEPTFTNEDKPIDIQFTPIKDRKSDFLEKEQLQNKLETMLSYNKMVTALVIDGEEVIYLKDTNDGEALIDHVVAYYIPVDGSQISHTIYNSIEFVEIFKESDTVVHSVEEAVKIIVRGTDEYKTHVVQRGESLWTIASKNAMSVDEIKEVNPNLRSDVLRIGQELSLTDSSPFLDVETVEEVTYKQNVSFAAQRRNDSSLWNWESRILQRGVQGSKEVTARITRVNGHEVERDVLEETIIQEPKPQIVVQGTRQPSRASTGRFLWPAAGRITSPYGPRAGGFHSGVDNAAPSGTPIYAAESGRVSFSGRLGNYGLLVIIDHSNGYQTYYAHNSSNLVKVGARVNKGDLIARMGSTGNSTGPHVHFEVRRNGNPINPMNFFR